MNIAYNINYGAEKLVVVDYSPLTTDYIFGMKYNGTGIDYSPVAFPLSSISSGGSISGTIATNQIPFGSGTNTISGSASLSITDTTNFNLIIGKSNLPNSNAGATQHNIYNINVANDQALTTGAEAGSASIMLQSFNTQTAPAYGYGGSIQFCMNRGTSTSPTMPLKGSNMGSIYFGSAATSGPNKGVIFSNGNINFYTSEDSVSGINTGGSISMETISNGGGSAGTGRPVAWFDANGNTGIGLGFGVNNVPVVPLDVNGTGRFLNGSSTGYVNIVVTDGNSNSISIEHYNSAYSGAAYYIANSSVLRSTAGNRLNIVTGGSDPINFWTNSTLAFSITASGVPQFNLGAHTGSTVSTLGTNSPASTTTPYTWIDVYAPDGTLCTMPIFRK